MRRAGAWLVASLLVVAAPAAAHKLAPSLLEVVERDGGRVAVRWKTPRVQPRGAALAPTLPARCREATPPLTSRDATSVTLRWEASCGEAPLVGETFGVEGLERSGTQALLRIELADGRAVRALLDGDDGALVVPERESARAVFASYVALGFEHIFTGLDHLLFVLGLVLLVSGARALVATVTAFTLGHSVTLSLAVLGFVAFPSDVAELAIAASVFVLALELCREPGRVSRLARRPWLMAAGFGLLHGLGFAGALVEVGLPEAEVPLSLFAFNVGIELGQLLFVAVVLVVGLVLASRLARVPRWVGLLPAYTIGSLAAFWCLQRGVALFVL